MVSVADGLRFFPPTITSFQFLADQFETVHGLLDMLQVLLETNWSESNGC